LERGPRGLINSEGANIYSRPLSDFAPEPIG